MKPHKDNEYRPALNILLEYYYTLVAKAAEEIPENR